MIYLRTGKPGASKSLNSLRELCLDHNPKRKKYYNNIRLLLLDMDVANSFSGWFYGWYLPRLKNKKQLRKIHKILEVIHEDDDFATQDDFPWLESEYEAHDNFQTWLYWVRRCYHSKHLKLLDAFLDATQDRVDVDRFAICKRFNLHFTQFDDVRYWYDLPKRSIILIDECQQFFPPRQVGSKVPPFIGKFETHRHRGYDVHLVTQDPNRIDVNVRRLTGRHVHFHNPFGGKTVTRYQQSKCFDPDQWFDLKAATKKPIRHDKKFYGVYWSSELHTHKFKMPSQVFVLIALILFVGFCAYHVSTIFADKESSPPPDSDSSSANVRSPASSSTSGDSIGNYFYDMTNDIYISGSSIELRTNNQRYFLYSFVKSETEEVFYPEYLGIVIEPQSHCFALLKFNEFTRPVTCNPFYKRQVQDSERDEEEISKGDTIFGKSSEA